MNLFSCYNDVCHDAIRRDPAELRRGGNHRQGGRPPMTHVLRQLPSRHIADIDDSAPRVPNTEVDFTSRPLAASRGIWNGVLLGIPAWFVLLLLGYLFL
jgi:hypothetical protein